jgi:transmembrane sensor
MAKPDYNQLEDFLDDESFKDWVRTGGYRQPESFWSVWIQANPQALPIVEEAKAMLLASWLDEETVPVAETEKAIQQVLWAIRQNPVPIIPIWRKTGLRVAASVILMIVAGYLYWQNSPKTGNPIGEQLRAEMGNVPLIEQHNQTTYRQLVTFPDGSKAWLQPNSQLRYPPVFKGANRVVYLSGEAFFSIKRNPQLPFLVYTNDLVTKVLGTSFTVKAFDDAQPVRVIVKTGKVSVFDRQDFVQSRNQSASELQGVVLTPNQQVAFTQSEDRFDKSLVQTPAPVVTTTTGTDFTFDDTPLTDVFERIEKVYGLTLVYDSQAMQHCRLTASLSSESLFEKLNLICRLTGATYEIVDAQIVINAKDCS